MSYSHCQDTDACPLMRINGEVNQLDEGDTDRTRHCVVSQGVVLEEVVKINKSDCTVDIDIEQERNTDITFREQGCDVVFRTEVNKSDCTVDIDIEQERNTDITLREQGCDVVFRTEVNKTDCTVDIDIEQERNTDITLREQGCDVVFRTEVNKTAHADETATVRKVSTNIIPLEECCDVVIKPADDGTEEAGTIQEESKYSVHKEESCVVQSSLQCHNISHSGVEPFTSTICNTSFTHKTRLMSHERFHSREKSAPLATQSNNLLRYRRMLHSGVKRYTCRKCKNYLHISLV